MNIRSRLLLLLLPSFTVFLILISCFFYFNWSREILMSFQARLESIVVSVAQNTPIYEVEWLIQHIHDSHIDTEQVYQRNLERLKLLQKQLPIVSIFLVEIETMSTKPYGNLGEFHIPQTFSSLMLLQAGEKHSTLHSDISTVAKNGEWQSYTTKTSYVTPIYEMTPSHKRIISAYVPLLDNHDNVIALVGADMDLQELDANLQRAWLIIFSAALISLLFVVLTVFIIADRISKPVKQLKRAALKIAAGDYTSNVQVKGPKEIEELAHTLNTMSECLVESISRLKESSLVRERMCGEYECALLLQNHMLHKIIEEFHHPYLRLILICVPSQSPLHHGVLLRCDMTKPDLLNIILLETTQSGFQGLFHLNQCASLHINHLPKHINWIECQFINKCHTLLYQTKALFSPAVWSIHDQQFIKPIMHNINLQNGDMIFLYNSSLIEEFKTQENIEAWLGRILRHFASDGVDAICQMLTKELNFLFKKKLTKHNYHIIGMQMHIPERIS